MRSYYVFAACIFALLQTGLPALAAPPPSKPSAVNVATAAAASHTPHIPRAGPLGILPGVGSSNSTSSGDATTTTSTVTSTVTITTTTITTTSETSTATGSAVTTANGAALVLPIKRQESLTIPVVQGLEVARTDPTGMVLVAPVFNIEAFDNVDPTSGRI